MARNIITIAPEKLPHLGFVLSGEDNLEAGESYKWWQLTVNDSNITCTVEYDLSGQPSCQYFELNGETMMGRSLTRRDILMLKEIL